jgi:AcrR family transcriptional regulator
MAQPARPMRADAARNRERVLEVAYKAFAVEGLSVSVDELAKRAGVGPGTMYRHFPSKEHLVRAVINDRLQHIVGEGHALLLSGDPGQALFGFMRSLVLKWGATNEGLKHALAGSGIPIKIGPADRAFLAIVDELLEVAQTKGSVRTDVSAKDIKALIIGCQAMQTYNGREAERMLGIVIDGLRPLSGKAGDRRGAAQPGGQAGTGRRRAPHTTR